MYEIQTSELARKMVRLEQIARAAATRGDIMRASEFLAEREMTAVVRSQFMRDMWAARKRE